MNDKKIKKQYESGHPKTLESFNKLIAKSELLDQTRLDPPDDLKLLALKDFLAECTGLQTNVGNSRADWRTVALDRATDIDLFDSLAAQAISAFEARGANREQLKDSRSYLKKLQGKRAKALKIVLDDEGNPILDESEKGISTAQTGSAAQIATFYELIDYLEAQPIYADVKKVGLRIADLRGFVDSTQAKHTASIIAAAKLSDDRRQRNQRFYLDADSINERARRFKRLVGSEYGLLSIEYKEIKAIPFRKPKL